MKIKYLLPSIVVAAAIAGACSDKAVDSNKLVILHTNDTHSQIDPGSDNLGGVMRRKAIIDSVRGAEKNVLLVDAGDAVQGTLYFYLYGGKVEQEVMNILGVETRILGNHEFDNGIDSLASVLKYSDAEMLSANYDLSKTPLEGRFKPYTIKEYNGKRIGIIGLNLDPNGIISPDNFKGLEYLPIVATANLTAEKLKKDEKVDAVIALTHIGYNPAGLVGDSVLATNSRDIDIIIGGHSHDTIDPTTENGARRSRLKNLEGKDVLVVQTGKSGRNVGKIEINLDSLGLGASPSYELIPVTERYDNYADTKLADYLSKYSAGVDSLMTMWIGTTAHELPASSPELLNYFTDFIYDSGSEIAPKVDLAIANKGGLRSGIPAGKFSKGQIINMLPFANYVTVLDVKGSDLAEVFDVMANTHGNGVSRNVSAEYVVSDDGAKSRNVLINGKPIDLEQTYRVATIDYLAKGGDYMTGLTRGNVVVTKKVPVFEDLVEYITTGKGAGRELGGDTEARWKSAGK
ncbi:MAG: bifunctional UDP-sugar hydrolase/5'-nucleotidase [Muribaculaceae bacterium]|jgi:5'-nucleotidase|nr:bifunctional UDP-sugar hydrolase/5'-nucleotidase [Muribaculaceae bacterium]